ncbi:MAG: hypothetical protein KJ847_02095 [Firmicutes bacterium]|nr:hypothetical protein [Bacillota bacterium]
MNCLTNINRTQIPHDIIMAYLNLYKSIGMNDYNHSILESDYQVMVRQTINNDTYFFVNFLGLNISETRLKSLIHKEVLPKNKDEKFILNLKKAFTKMHKETSSFELLTTEVFDLLRFLYKDVLTDSKVAFQKVEKKGQKVSLLSSNVSSKRDDLESLIRLYQETIDENKYEVSFIIVNFLIDFVNISPFIEKNNEIGILLAYLLLLTNSYEVFEYISFMELLYESRNEFDRVYKNASFNWVEGFSQVLPLHRYFLNISLQAYDRINAVIRDYEFDSQLNKSNNVENTIDKLEDIFSKDDIRIVHPFISDSTINRTLKRLRDEEKIRPLGVGRSAKWIKLYVSKNKKMKFEQLDLKI